MIYRGNRRCLVCFLSVLMAFLLFLVNIYFLHLIAIAGETPQDVSINTDSNPNALAQISTSKTLNTNTNSKFYFMFEHLKKQLSRNGDYNTSTVWDVAKKWTNNGVIYNPIDSNLANIVQAMRTAPVIQIENSRRGTQFKLALKLQGNQTVLFKPQWYKRNHIIKGGVYSGKDRHTAEVVAFYLSLLLDIRWVPLAIMRKLNAKKEIWDLADEQTRKTMFFYENNNTVCMYGKCLYCRQNETVCDDRKGEIEGAVILMVGGALRKYRSPWQRTYSHKTAEWEHNENYCSGVKKQLPLIRILDLVDGGILDFLMQNGDRHHYETFTERVVFLDNGKGLGNPYKDHTDILAPLYQCCMIRSSTWDRLKLLSGGSLSSALSILTSNEVGAPILTQDHLDALDRRLITVYETVNKCVAKHGKFVFKNS